MQYHLKKSDAVFVPAALRSLKYSNERSVENFFSSGFSRVGTNSIDILLEPAFLLEFPDKSDGLIGRARAEFRYDIDQRAFDILRHPLGISTNVDMCAFGKPCPDFAADLAHSILHIEFFVAIARPGQRKPRQKPRSFHGIQFIGVEEIAGAALVAEEQPVLAGTTRRLAVMEERAEWRHSGARPNHDDRGVGFSGNANPWAFCT